MVFPWAAASFVETAGVLYNPSPLSPALGGTQYPRGITSNFGSNAIIDPSRSVDWLSESAPNAQYPNLRSVISQWRKKMDQFVYEDFSNDQLPNWSRFVTGSGFSGAYWEPDPDPAVHGYCLDLHSGASLNSMAGIQRVVNTVGDTFSFGTLNRQWNPSTSSNDGLDTMLQNNHGRTLWMRNYDDTCCIYHNGSFETAINHGGNYWTEWWAKATYLYFDGTNEHHKLDLWAGTEHVWSVADTILPIGFLGGNNNTAVICQNGNSNTYRRGSVSHFTAGETQLTVPMTVCSNQIPVIIPPTKAYIKIMLENISMNIGPGTNVRANFSIDDLVTTVNAPLTLEGVCGKGEVDNSKDVWCLIGEAALTGTAHTGLRFIIETDEGVFAPLQSVTMMWDY